MESVYDRFNSYDFEGDDNFQRGLRNIQESAAENMLKLKLFYYNRFIEPVDLEGYRQWSRCRIPLSVSTDGLEPRLEGINQVTKLTEKSDHEQVPLDSSSIERNECLSFAEVFRLIQAGEDVPGVEKLDIRPCKQPPTVSQMPRRSKPWENNE